MYEKAHSFAGIDISKNSLDICLLYADKPQESQHHTIANTLKAIAFFLKLLPVSAVLFCIEDTGVYGMPLCQVLENADLDYAVVPASKIKRSKGLQRCKSDKADAKDIARYASAWDQAIQLPEPDMQELKLLIAEREKLIKAIKSLKPLRKTLALWAKSYVHH